MCFSANVSFAAAGALSVIGLLSVHAARHNKKMIPLAASPLFFAAQQACEGLVWITFANGTTTGLLHNIGMYGFLFLWVIFAFCIFSSASAPEREIKNIQNRGSGGGLRQAEPRESRRA